MKKPIIPQWLWIAYGASYPEQRMSDEDMKAFVPAAGKRTPRSKHQTEQPKEYHDLRMSATAPGGAQPNP